MATKPKPKTIKVTLKNQQYEIDLKTLTGRERVEAKRLLERDEFHIAMLLQDEIGALVLSYLAARRTDPTIRFEDVLDLTGEDVVVDFSAFDEPSDEDTAGPFDGSETKASNGKTSSGKSSPAA